MNHPPPSNAEVKERGIPQLPPWAFMVCFRAKFTYTLCLKIRFFRSCVKSGLRSSDRDSFRIQIHNATDRRSCSLLSFSFFYKTCLTNVETHAICPSKTSKQCARSSTSHLCLFHLTTQNMTYVSAPERDPRFAAATSSQAGRQPT